MALTFNDQQEAELLSTLGLPEADPGQTDAELVLDTVKDLATQSDGTDPAKPSAIVAAAKAAGLGELVDPATLAALRNDAAEGRRLTAAAQIAKVENDVDTAIGLGKIAPARREHWVNLIQADPGMAQVLADVPPETAVPMTELGHSTEPEASAAEWFY
ncbi:phage protease [Mycobacterium kyogaense]|uniref:phage protease n=1 Tax=Mycobacterium kyogaense TaxID=2212479 RepID=UPI000DAD4BBA|nr:phage protease [Mycobacterium kyogaense]